jgi:hypothetical protein
VGGVDRRGKAGEAGPHDHDPGTTGSLRRRGHG